jgi:hypothetical protein
MKITPILDMLLASGSPGSALAYQLGSSGAGAAMLRSKIAPGGATEAVKPAPGATFGGWPRQLDETTMPPAMAFEPSPIVSVEAIERAQREAHRLRAEVIHEMLGAAGAWLWRLARRTVRSTRSV